MQFSKPKMQKKVEQASNISYKKVKNNATMLNYKLWSQGSLRKT